LDEMNHHVIIEAVHQGLARPLSWLGRVASILYHLDPRLGVAYALLKLAASPAHVVVHAAIHFARDDIAPSSSRALLIEERTPSDRPLRP
jgi:hypothetical protein